MQPVECPLCSAANEIVLWYDRRCRVVQVDDANYPGFCRVIWRAHMREMSDLTANDRMRLMRVVFAVEQGLRALMRPDKINLASLGNQVPHLHWHVIPRFRDDAHFPDSVWSQSKRTSTPRVFATVSLKEYLLTNLKEEYT